MLVPGNSIPKYRLSLELTNLMHINFENFESVSIVRAKYFVVHKSCHNVTPRCNVICRMFINKNFNIIAKKILFIELNCIRVS